MIARLPLVHVTVRGVLGRRRTWLMILLAALPIGVALLIRLGGGQPNAQTILDTLIIRTVMPLLAIILVGVPVANVLHRAGRSRWWTVLAFVPGLNLIALWVFAFSRWPSLLK